MNECDRRAAYREKLTTCTDECRWKCLGDGFTMRFVTEEELRAHSPWKEFHPDLHGKDLAVKVEEVMEDAWGQD